MDDRSAAGVEIVSLIPHREFTMALAAAPLVVTAGGSVQEECALLGVPTLLWRHRTERSDGLGENVVLTHYDRVAIESTLVDHEGWSGQPRWLQGPSTPASFVDTLLAATTTDADPPR